MSGRGSSELPFEITLDDMIDEVERELNMRRDVYGRRVRENGMNRRRADRQIDVMAAIRDKLKGERDASKGDRDR
jgi:hypothetical protein